MMGPKLARRKIDDARKLALEVLGELEAMGRILAVDAAGCSLAPAWVEPTAALGWKTSVRSSVRVVSRNDAELPQLVRIHPS
jgi:hypothetical protein